MEQKIIMLVEDDPDDETLTLHALSKCVVRHRVIVARDGVEALDYLFANARDARGAAESFPDVVLLDVKLPKVDGFTVLRRLRADQRTRFLPVVMLTSSAEERDVHEAYNSGANSYVCKPVDFEQFGEIIEQLGLYWLKLNQAPEERSG